MSLVDFDHRRFESPVAVAVHTLAGWLVTLGTKRKQDAALQSLLFTPEHRLRDLGITRDQLIRAIEIHRK